MENTITPKEAARILNISNSTIYRWIKRGWVNGIVLPNGYIRLSKPMIDELAKKGVEDLQDAFAGSAKW